jgi:hypothetical protein
MKKELTFDEVEKLIEDTRFVAGVLNFMAAVFVSDDARCALTEESYWVLADAESRIKKTLEFLNA